jgi:clathrin heavy chain
MARNKMKDSHVDSELVYCLALSNQLAALEEFVSAPNVAKIQQIGDRVFDEKMYEAAKVLFTAIGNHGRLASALVHLGQFQAAVDAARKANSTRTWKEVAFACVDAEEFALARTCGLAIIVHADELEELCWHYEKRGHFEHLISLLEAGLPSERAHMGLFTELGRLYSRYKPGKLMEFIKANTAKLNIPRLIRACELDHHWAELRFLHANFDEHDNAVRVMMEHPTEAWEHGIFKDILVHCKNPEMPHRAVDFYLQVAPMQLNDMLLAVLSKIDYNRVVADVKRAQSLPLIKGFLEAVQAAGTNSASVNEAVNGLYIEDEDFAALRSSIEKYDKFDAISLAQRLEKHELLEFRRVAADLYKRANRWKQSVELSKRDKLYRDAMDSAAQSKDSAVAEDLLTFFVKEGLQSCFVACLFTCYDLLRADVVLELAWSNKLTDFAMPYFVQMLREYTSRVDVLHNEREERLAKEKKAAEGELDEPNYAPAAATPIPGLIAMQATGMLAMQPTGMMGMQPTGMMMGGYAEPAALQFMATGTMGGYGMGGMGGYGMGGGF